MFIPARFGTNWATATELPYYDTEWDVGGGGVYAPMIPTIGGVQYNVVGSSTAKGDTESLEYRAVGIYTSTALRDIQIAAMNTLRGQYNKLWTDDGTYQHWRYARFKRVSARPDVRIPTMVRFSFLFDFERGNWNDSVAVDQSITLNVSPKGITLTNAGDVAVTRVVFNITAGSANITALTCVNAAGTIKWSYAGTILAGQTLEIHTGGQWAKNNGVYDTDNFALDTAGLHSVDEWMVLNPSTDTILTVTFTGGAADSNWRSIYNAAWSI